MEKVDIQKLYEISGDGSVKFAEDLQSLVRYLNRNYQVKIFLEDNDIIASARKDIFGKAFPSSSQIFKDLIDLLIDRSLMRTLSLISEEFTFLVMQRTGIVFAELTSAFPIEEDTQNNILANFGDNMRVKAFIDPKLLGGYVLKFFDGRVYDASLLGRLSELKSEIAR